MNQSIMRWLGAVFVICSVVVSVLHLSRIVDLKTMLLAGPLFIAGILLLIAARRNRNQSNDSAL